MRAVRTVTFYIHPRVICSVLANISHLQGSSSAQT
jgi:hypothetical protein